MKMANAVWCGGVYSGGQGFGRGLSGDPDKRRAEGYLLPLDFYY
jgi:hypothetical protein